MSVKTPHTAARARPSAAPQGCTPAGGQMEFMHEVLHSGAEPPATIAGFRGALQGTPIHGVAPQARKFFCKVDGVRPGVASASALPIPRFRESRSVSLSALDFSF